MVEDLLYEPLASHHAEELAAVLLNDQVFAYIGGHPPSAEQYGKRVQSILAGPPPRHPGIRFCNYVARLASTGQVVGTLESTLHDGIAEVAYLFGPQYWGKRYASAGLAWLSVELMSRGDLRSLWATTDPRNLRSVALLGRCGYRAVSHELAPELYSYEPGDLVYTSEGAA